MKPPIASPFGDIAPDATLSKRVEWDAARACFVLLRHDVSFWTLMRCELYIGVRRKRMLLVWIFGWPLMLLLALFIVLRFHQISDNPAPDEFLIFDWGYQTATMETVFQTKWENITRVFLNRGDIYINRTSAHFSNSYLCREYFESDAERTRFLAILESLRARNGANWEEVVRHFRT